MFNAMKYIKALEAAGVGRAQAEAHVQLVFEAMEGELVTKSEFNSFRQSEFNSFREQVERRFDQVDARFDQMESGFDKKLLELEFRMTTRLGFFIVSSMTITIAVLGWLK